MSETNTERLKAALNLDREPFSDEGVAGLFFPGGGRQELVEQLIHLSRYGPSLIILAGDNGAGKSAVVRQMEARLDPSVFQCVHIEADVLADENLLFQRIAETFHLDLGYDEDAAIEVLIRYARELDGYSQTPLLVIDEAQNLSASAIGFIMRLLDRSARSGLHCLLCMDGNPPEKIPLLRPVLSSDLDHQVLELPALDNDAVEEYLDYRMTTSGLSDIQFSADQKRQIKNQSMGNIDRINIVARQILVEHFPYEKNRKKPPRLPLLHGVVVALLGVVLVFAYLVVPDLANKSVVEVPPVVPAAQPEPRVSEKMFAERSDTAAYQSLDDEAEPEAVEPVEMSVVTAPEPAVDHKSEKEAEQVLDTFTSTQNAVDFNYSESGIDEELLQPVTPQKATADVVMAVQGETADPVSAPSDVESTDSAQRAVPEVKKQSVVKAADALTPREKWLLSLDKAQFTLQMLGASEEASVQKFLAKYPSLKDIAYYRTTLRERDWYVVVYGLYGSKETAKQALTQLPKPLRESGPWARSIESVQQEIRKRD